jgi:uncharacterized protein YdhG (YjbR/CyaY superfamily)
MAGKPRTIDEYLAAVSDDQRAALEKLRKTIRAAAPSAEECISYQLAAFRLGGRPLVAFGATAGHCAFYPMSGSTVAAHKDELKGYETSKGTIRFQATKPLPASLVKKAREGPDRGAGRLMRTVPRHFHGSKSSVADTDAAILEAAKAWKRASRRRRPWAEKCCCSRSRVEHEDAVLVGDADHHVRAPMHL